MPAWPRPRGPELTVLESVELDRYLGTWYEIASYPVWFQRDCTAVTAHCSLRDNGRIKVVDSCRKGSLDGKLKQSTCRARVVDADSNAKLKVSFFGPFWGKYHRSRSGLPVGCRRRTEKEVSGSKPDACRCQIILSTDRPTNSTPSAAENVPVLPTIAGLDSMLTSGIAVWIFAADDR